MNSKFLNKTSILYIVIICILANTINSLSILNEKIENKSDQGDTTIKDVNIQSNQLKSNQIQNNNQYNYNLTDVEPIDSENKNEYEQMEKNCCLLAKIAAQRGFHCNLKFYSHKLLWRVRNRTHRKHVQIIGNNKEQIFNKQLIVKLSKCFENGLNEIFEYCCWLEVENNLEY